MFKHLVAKLSPKADSWLPLWVHSLDTCGVAEHLLTEWLPRGAKSALVDNLSDEGLLRLIRLLAVQHDIGKATSLFQTRITSKVPALQTRLKQAGFVLLDEQSLLQQENLHFSHAAAGEALLLVAGAPLSFSEIIGAHHGQPWSEGRNIAPELENNSNWSDIRAISLWGKGKHQNIWKNAQTGFLRWTLSETGLTGFEGIPHISQSAAVLLTGLIIMADWIASNEEYFPLISLDSVVPDDLAQRTERGWEKLNLPPSWCSCETSNWDTLSHESFGFFPNMVQKTMMQVMHSCTMPGLIILEAPMGLGKTEASLLTANLLAQKGAGGIFFGLPTQATANAIFNRIVGWGNRQSNSNQVSIRLAHGMAELNEDYRNLMAGDHTATVEEDGTPDKLVVHEWFRGRKQALLADFVVGTVDQVLMAALRQKHMMLRHLGLCGKVVIIDECHAYDAYMNQYLEEALRWLGQYHAPVIMLSATLPAQRRADFVAAYLNISSRASKRLAAEEWYSNRAYPALTWTDGDMVRQQGIAYSGPERYVSIGRIQHDESLDSQISVCVSLLQECLQDGGCAAIVLNTVYRAQAFAEALRQVLPAYTILLLHSRFVMQDRLCYEKELLTHMGKNSTACDRDRVIVVGTQVIEQSLDYDADVMISDLCPIDLLLQRIGRLHRHNGHDSIRPERLSEPKCYVLGAGETLDRGACSVYGRYLLMRTRDMLPERVCLPKDIPVLVNDVYDEHVPLAKVPPGYETAVEEENAKRKKLEQDAKAFRIHDPDKKSFGELLNADIPSDDEHARAQVRAGELSMDVLLLVRKNSEELTLLPWLQKDKDWKKDVCPSSEDSRILLAQRVGLPAMLVRMLQREMTWEELQNALRLPDAWEKTPLLKRSHMLVLDERLQTKLDGIVLKYTEDLGLQWLKEGEEN